MSHHDRERSHPVSSLRGPAAWILVGQLAFVVITQFHPGGDANDHQAIFATYARSDVWGAVHALQFVATGVMVAGLVGLCSALKPVTDTGRWAARIGAAVAVASLAIYGVLQAVDGVGNKQVDQAWIAAEGAQRSVRFANAETMRWLEWGMSSYYSYAAGLAIIAIAVAVGVARQVRPAGAIAFLVGLSGVAMVVRGWFAGAHGFTGTHSAMIVTTWVLNLAWASWLIAAGRPAAARQG